VASSEEGARVEKLNLTRLPGGQREWPSFVQSLSEVDDRAERNFLELKCDLDLSTTQGQAKVAKFILGAANRAPELAARRFGGHALLVLGVSKGAIRGIPFFEAKDLERTVKKFVGAEGPGWDFERVRVSDERDVIVVIVDPPRLGDPVWTCYADGHENLKNGGIYIRADGETREARGDEVRVLLRRAEAKQPTADLAVEILGSALPYCCDAAVIGDYVDTERARLEAAYRGHQRPALGGWGKSASAALSQAALLSGRPDGRSHQEYLDEIDEWEEEVRAAWPKVLDAATAYAATPVCLRVRNLGTTFLEELEIRVHLDGAVRAVDAPGPGDDSPLDGLPDPPRAWGPLPHAAFDLGRFPDDLLPYRPPIGPISSVYGSVSFNNGGSVDLELALKHLRPEEDWRSDHDFVLLLPDTATGEITGTWTVTARGHH
jgi:hypothetical protein